MRFLLLAALFFIPLMVVSQPPQLFKYQGLARAADGTPLADSAISIRITIHKDNPTGAVAYQETHAVTTNTFGAFSINIGGGAVNTGSFSTIAWNRGSFFQEVELNNVPMGTSQYLSVPYSLAADSARTGIAPFWVRNYTSGSDTANVAIIAIGNNGKDEAPVLFCKNFSNGTTLYAESGNGIFILGDSSGLETNGNARIGGEADISGGLDVQGNFFTNGSVQVNGPFLNSSQINATNINTSNTVFANMLSAASLSINGNGTIAGNLNVTGALSKGSGSFKIDHPLDPLNKFLYHSFVESPDMKNIYDGIVVTGADGKASVELPAYFEALNKDFRYQLTPVGQFAQAIILAEVNNNSFVIQTDKPFVKISWQITGIRKDRYAEKFPIIPEVGKTPGEAGKYLYPAAYQTEGEKN